MSRQDWFRRITWSERDRDDFFARLKRTRKSSRAQFLKIQAHHLLNSKSLKDVNSALELVDLALDEYPDRNHLAQLLGLKAKSLHRIGRLKEAEDNYLAAIHAMREVPNVKPDVHFSFGTFVIEHKIKRLYRDILRMLDEFTDIRHGLVLPVTEYYYYGIKAILMEREGDVDSAKLLAQKALAAADRKSSGLPRHPRVGLLNEKEIVFHDELVGIAQ